jgi:hypothetical protein
MGSEGIEWVSVSCRECGGAVHMVTCDQVYNTGHEWALASICFGCLNAHVLARPCPECRGLGGPDGE